MRTASAKGKLVVVGGHSRRVGKTCMMNAILRAVPAMTWRAWKISNHSHGASPGPVAPTPQAELLRLRDDEFPEGVGQLARLREEGINLLVESNRIVSYLEPDLVIFAIDPLNPDWKTSSAPCLERADALVFSQDGPCPANLLELRRILPAFRLTNWNRTPLGFTEWLRSRLGAAEVTSHETSLAGSSTCGSSRRGTKAYGPRAHEMGQRAGTGIDPVPLRSVELV